MDVNIWLITGWRGSGKTTFCREMVETAHQSGWDVAGLLSTAVFKGEHKKSIFAEAIRSSEKRLLAATHQQSGTDLAFGDWYFNEQTLAWGNQVLKSSVPCDMLVIDELGPLEFNLSSGWVSALDVIKTAQFRLALVVIRPELLESAQRIIQPTHVIHLNDVKEVHSRVLQYATWLMRLKE